jgi:hypothetical protein
VDHLLLFPLNSMPLIVLLDADVMHGVDQVDGGVMVGESPQG